MSESMRNSAMGDRAELLAYLAEQRRALRVAAHGLTDEQARATPTASTLCLGGLIKHVTRVEQRWTVVFIDERELPGRWPPPDRSAEFRLSDEESLNSVLNDYAVTAAHTESIVAEVTDLGRPVRVPAGWGRLPMGVSSWSVRGVLLHLIEETARHAGHADVIRETLDGATTEQLLAPAP